MSRKRTTLKTFFYGCLFGFAASAVYVIAGGDLWLAIPAWAWALFWPGFIIGEAAYLFLADYGLQDMSLIIGFVSVAAYYGLLALLMHVVSSARGKEACT